MQQFAYLNTDFLSPGLLIPSLQGFNRRGHEGLLLLLPVLLALEPFPTFWSAGLQRRQARPSSRTAGAGAGQGIEQTNRLEAAAQRRNDPRAKRALDDTQNRPSR